MTTKKKVASKAKKTAKKSVKKVIAKAVPQPTQKQDIRVEKIKNGYLTTKETYNKKNGWGCEKVYTQENPLKI